MSMALEEPDDNLVSAECQGIPFQYEKPLQSFVEDTKIDYVKTFWGEGLTMRSNGGGC
ncbi:MAG: hypothetical protein JW760_10590 [Spirochaetales bacterium]|nr:hypothetical protein [Spirochaetales bacterium]